MTVGENIHSIIIYATCVPSFIHSVEWQ